jgi:hypothetical protein
MKKIISCALAILMVAVLSTGCGNSKEAANTSGAAGSAQSGNQSSATPGNLGDKLSATYADMMKSGKYYMKYKTSMDIEGQKMEVEASMAVSGEDMALSTKGSGYEANIIVKNNKSYMVDHQNKTVMLLAENANQTGSSPEDNQDINTDGIVYSSSGTGSFKGKTLPYEEYSTSDGKIRYYFDGKKLYGIEVIAQGATVQMEILEMSNNVSDSMFEIPASYTKLDLQNLAK